MPGYTETEATSLSSMEPALDTGASRDIAASILESLPDPARSRHILERFQREAPAAFPRVAESPAALRYLLTIGSYSSFLADAVIRHPDWLLDLSESPKIRRIMTAQDFEAELGGFRSAFDLAAFRRRQLLRIVLRDVLRLATLFEVTEELSNLADAILNIANRQILEQTSEQFGRPRGENGPALFSVLSLGKLGGRELNYSSDIDLMFIYSGNGEIPGGLTNREFFKKAANLLTEMLSTYTGEGMCYRVDLRLRPDGRYGEVCQSLEGAKHYYQHRARDWELQMLIKARVSAGNAEPGRELLEAADPAIYSTSTDFKAIESVSEARQRIHEKLKRANQPGIDVKLTGGGIRDIEFLAQCLQRLHGGRDPWLRHGGTHQALTRLHEKGLLSTSEYATLISTYEFLRVLEHRLQFDEDRQTHTLPTDRNALEILARKMPGTVTGSIEQTLNERLAGVRDIYERVIHAQRPTHSPTVRPDQPRNDRMKRFAEKIAQRKDWLDLLERNPEVSACATDLFVHSRFFGDQLIRYPELIEEIAVACGNRQGRTGFDPPLDVPALRVFFRQQMMRIQADSLYHAVPIFKTLKRTSNLADAVLASAYRIAVNEALVSVAPAQYQPASQMMVIALGRLGMREFDIASDADLVFAIPDADAGEVTFWTFVAERLIRVIGAYTGDGALFKVDTRLRPNGREGALVQTESAFREYFEKHAEAWEGISYMKARAVAGDIARATEFLSGLQQLDWRRYGQSGRSRHELAGMRARLEREQGRRHPLKAGPGGYYDIDFALMYYRLKGAGMFFKSLTTPERVDIIEKMGHLEREDAEFLREAATFYRAVDHALRISTGHAEGRLPASPADLAALTELVVRWDPASAKGPLDARLQEIQQRTRAFYERVFN
jgi:glutamate-ammonia-ligase adenylyltransferase